MLSSPLGLFLSPLLLLLIVLSLSALPAQGSFEMFQPGYVENNNVKEMTMNCFVLPPGTTFHPSPCTTCTCFIFGFMKCVNDTTSPQCQPAPPVQPHPLDPLTSDEITQTMQVIEAYQGPISGGSSSSSSGGGGGNDSYSRADPGPTKYIYNWITLKEPPKALLLPFFLNNVDYPPKGSIPRESFSVLIDRTTLSVYEAVVNLDTKMVESFVGPIDPEPGQVPYSPEDLLLAERVVREDPTVAARCAALGYPNMSLVFADAWSMGYIGDMPALQGKRLITEYLYGRSFPDDNQYAHPFDFIAIVDLDTQSVVQIQDLPTHDDFDATNKEGNTVPQTDRNYDYRLRGGRSFLRKDDKPIVVESPEGPSFKVNGYLINWQKWKIRVGFNGREGLILYLVSYNDGGNVRPVWYRSSIAEMYIPYGDPRTPYYRKAVFDMGEYGEGFNADKQVQGEDIIGASKLWDVFLNNSTGQGVRYKGAVSLREEDAGILWKHVDYRTGEGVVVRSHRIVFSYIATVGNYEYIFLWSFYQDGSIHLDVQMTGILSINLLAKGAGATPWGSIMAPQLNAMYHQHFFALRADVEIDGNLNSISTSDVVSLPQPTGSAQNPYGQGFTVNKTLLRTAGEARTKISPISGRVWIVDGGKVHPYTGNNMGWKLMPKNSPPLLEKADCPLRPKAAFLDYDVWTTPYKENQFYPGGFYLNNTGLREWVANDPGASVSQADIVLWHMFGLTHIPRVEDFPVMPVESTGFQFKPYNFFLENPGIDVPPSQSGKGDEL